MWINYNHQLKKYLNDTSFNNSVLLNRSNVDALLTLNDTLLDAFANSTESFASLRWYPFKIFLDVPDDSYSLRTVSILQTEAKCKPFNKKYLYLDMGHSATRVSGGEFYNFNGYTTIKIYLPMYGFVDIDVNECVGKYLYFRLSMDYITGKGVYIIGVGDNTPKNRDVYYISSAETDDDFKVIGVYECQIGVDIPLGSTNAGQMYSNICLNAISGLSYLINPTSPIQAVTTTASQSTTAYDIKGKSLKKGSRMKQIKSGTETTETNKTKTVSKPVNKMSDLTESVSSFMSSLNNKLSGSTDTPRCSQTLVNLSNQIIIVTYRPKIVDIDENEYRKLYGMPLNQCIKLDDITGYTEIGAIHFEGEGFSAITNDEKKLLENVVAEGIII